MALTAVRRESLALALAVAVSSAGCVTVRSAPPAFTDVWPPAEGGPRPTLTLVVSGGAVVDGIPRDLGPILDDWGWATNRAYRESGLFSDVLLRAGRSDLHAAVTLRAEVQQSDVLTALSYLTLLIIPNVVTTEIIVATSITTDKGEPLGTIEVRGRSRTWYQLLLLPVTPFFEPHGVSPEIVYDLNRQTIATLHGRGVF